MTKPLKQPRIDPAQFELYRAAGVTLMPLRSYPNKNCKLPLKGWRTNAYNAAKIIANSVNANRNIGWRVDDGWLAFDFDPRNALGDDELSMMFKHYRIEPSSVPMVGSGASGTHAYFRAPPGVKFRNIVPRFPAVECKGVARLVVCAGSIHPTGKLYRWRVGCPPLGDAPMLPAALLADIERPAPVANFVEDSARIEPEQLAEILSTLPADDFNTNDTWEPVMMAAHHATGGAGMFEFIEWSLSDPNFSDQAAVIEARWNSLDPNKIGGRTVGTLYDLAKKYGHAELIPKPTAAEDFADDPVDVDAIKTQDEAKPAAKKKIIFTPFVLRPYDQLPPREFIYKPIYLRKFLSLTTALGGTGKSRLVMTEAVAMASGKPLLGIAPLGRLRVVYWNGEDTEDEIDRGLHAVCKYYELDKRDIEKYLWRDSGRVLPIKLATMKNGTASIAEPLVAELRRALDDLNADALIIDPFVASHSVTENDSHTMELVAKKWAHIADAGNLAVGIVHHNRKPVGGQVGSIDDARGSTAIINAARIRRAVNTMTEGQANAGAIDPARRRFYISADLSNTNVMKPATALTWYELESVDLGNMTIDQDSDEIGVPVAYEYVTIEAVETTAEQADTVLAALRQRDDWRTDMRSADWIGVEIGKQLGLLMEGDGHKKERKRVRNLIADWIKEGKLVEYEGRDKNRMKRALIKVGCISASVGASVSDAD